MSGIIHFRSPKMLSDFLVENHIQIGQIIDVDVKDGDFVLKLA